MRYIFFSLILAMVFDFGIHSFYGTEGLLQQFCVEYVFWATIFAGTLSGLVVSTRRLLCKILLMRNIRPCNAPSSDLSPRGTAY